MHMKINDFTAYHSFSNPDSIKKTVQCKASASQQGICNVNYSISSKQDKRKTKRPPERPNPLKRLGINVLGNLKKMKTILERK